MTGISAAAPGVSILVLRHLVQFAQRHALDPGPLLAEAGLSEDGLWAAEGWVPAAQVERLLQVALARIASPVVGLLAAPQVNLSLLGVLGYVTQTSSTVQGLIESTTRFERLLSDIGTTTLCHQPGAAHWQWDCAFADAVVRRHAVECVLGCWAGLLRMARRPSPRPLLAVHFRHALPGGVAQAVYERFFDAPVHFSQAENALVLAPAALSLPLALADPALHQALANHASRQLAARQQETDLVAAVRALLQQEVQQGIAPVRERVAGQLGISTRSLHRRLDEAGSSFRALVDEARLALAVQLLQDSSLPVAQVALQLGFQESQSFIRWFKRVQGVTPGEFRRG
ncbi:MAG: AraC family transcriptional regulator [Moraxellaceae bacterium]